MTTRSPEWETYWQNQLSSFPQSRQEFKKAEKLHQHLTFTHQIVTQATIEQEWTKLQELLETPEVPLHPKTKRPVFLKGRLAAMILLLLLAGAGYLYTRQAASEASLVSQSAMKGQRLSIRLPDGSTILLNAGSTLRYPNVFPSGKREVFLDGEAFFNVASNPEAPFVIHSGEVITEVLGTSFNIAAYPSQPKVSIAVVSGKVKVSTTSSTSSDGQEVVLHPQQMATFKPADKALSISEFNEAHQLAWTEGILYFDKANFEQMKEQLENWYGVTIHIDPLFKPDSNLLFSGKYTNKPLEAILDVHRYPNRFQYTREGDTIFIQPFHPN